MDGSQQVKVVAIDGAADGTIAEVEVFSAGRVVRARIVARHGAWSIHVEDQEMCGLRVVQRIGEPLDQGDLIAIAASLLGHEPARGHARDGYILEGRERDVWEIKSPNLPTLEIRLSASLAGHEHSHAAAIARAWTATRRGEVPTGIGAMAALVTVRDPLGDIGRVERVYGPTHRGPLGLVRGSRVLLHNPNPLTELDPLATVDRRRRFEVRHPRVGAHRGYGTSLVLEWTSQEQADVDVMAFVAAPGWGTGRVAALLGISPADVLVVDRELQGWRIADLVDGHLMDGGSRVAMICADAGRYAEIAALEDRSIHLVTTERAVEHFSRPPRGSLLLTPVESPTGD